MNMRMMTAFALFVLFAMPIVAAQDIQEIMMALNASGVTNLVNVTNSINFSQLVPDYQYAAKLMVNWAIPDESLQSITAERIVVFALINVDPAVPFVYFMDNGNRTDTTVMILRCDIADAMCTSTSELSKEVQYYITLPNAATSLQDTNVFRVRASLMPFDRFTEIVAKRMALNLSAAGLRADISSLPPSTDSLYLLSRLAAVERNITLYQIDGLDIELDAINTSIGQLRTRAAMNTQLVDLEKQFNDVLNTSLTNLTVKENVIKQEAATALESAKGEVMNFEFTSAQQSMLTVQNRTATLASMITERQKTLPQKITEFVDSIGGNWVYNAVVGILALVVLFLIALRLRGDGGRPKPKPRR